MNPTDNHLRTERLLLRPLTKEDYYEIFPIIKDNWELCKYMSWVPPKTIEEALEAFKKMQVEIEKKKLVRWGLFLDGKFAGHISIKGIVWTTGRRKMDLGELGYWTNPTYAGQGLMTEAVPAVLKFGFEVLGLHKIKVSANTENAASLRVIQKCGFRYVGRRKDHYFEFGRWWDLDIYEMTCEEFREVLR